MAFFKKGFLGKVSLISIFLFFILFTIAFINMSVADSSVFSFDKQFSCNGCDNSLVPPNTEVEVLIDVSFIHFKDEDGKLILVEVLPSGWNVMSTGGGTVSSSGYYNTIEWDVDLSDGTKNYDSDDYEIVEVQKTFSVTSPSVDEPQEFNFITRTDKDIGSVEVTVYPSIIKESDQDSISSKADVISSDESGNRYVKRLKTNQSRKVYTDIPERLEKEGYSIKLYRIRGSSREDVTNDHEYNVSFVDSDGNGVADKLEWEAQESDQIFEIEAYIEIINVQSYPTVGGNWTVKFNTTGTADLKITAINGTTFGKDTPDDLKFLEVRCDDKILSPIIIGNSILYRNYNCDGTGYEVSRVLTIGKHYLEFDFGGQKAYASNDADVFETGRVETNGWTTVNTKRTYTNPIVVVYPVEGNETPGGAPISGDHEVSQAVVTNVTSTSFQVQLYNETNGALAGNVSYIVVENGTHILSNGMLLQAGKVSTSSYNANGVGGTSFQSITFYDSYASNPTVVASPQMDSAQDWVSVRWQTLSTSGISLSLEIDQSYGTGPIAASSVGSGENNEIGWIAINSTSAESMEGNIESSVDEDPTAGDWRTLTFSNTYTTPIFFAIDEENGGSDPCTVGRRNLAGTGVDIRLTEERTDNEQTHATENVLWMVFETDLGNGPPTAPTEIECDGSSDCNITVNTDVDVNASGSTDSDGDNVTYYIEASLENLTQSDDQETGNVGFLGEQSITTDYNSTITALNPEARWMLNGDGTDSADSHDDSGGTLPSFVASIIPNAPAPYCGDFDGSADELHIPDDPNINTGSSTQKAISVWIVADTIDTTGNGRGIWTEGGTGNSLSVYTFNNGTSDNIYCIAAESSGANRDWVEYPISEGGLYHIGCMFDFAGGRIDMYINGTLVSSDTSLITGTDLGSHGNNNALGGVDQNTINHAGAQISGNFDGRIADLVYWTSGSNITQENFTAIYEAGVDTGSSDIDATKDWQTYNDILDNDWKNITEINVTVYVSTYDNSGSGLNGNDYPDLQLEMATSDGGGWTEVGNFSISGTGNATLTTTDSSILNAWLDKDVSDLRIRGVNFDYNDPSNYDKINFTGVWVGIDGSNWILIGNHTNETLINWNTTDMTEQTCIDFRARAIDLDGAATYSDYFTKGACLNISHADSSPPVWSGNSTSVASGTQYLPGRQYQFNVSWDDPDTGVSTVLIEQNFSGGSPTNVTVTTNDSDVYYFDVSDLAAGTYVWRGFANNTDDYWNVTNGGIYWSYTVDKNTSTQDLMNLTLGVGTSGSESNYQDMYPVTTNATGWYSSVLGNQDITFTLYRNDTGIGSSNPQNDIVQFGTGFYVYTYNTSGNENYTSSSKQLNLTIQQNDTNPIDLYFVNSSGVFVNQNMTISYEKQTNVTSFNLYEDSGTLYLFRDGVNVTDTEYDQWMTLGYNAGGYAYKINTSGNENYSSNDTGATYYITVNKKQTETYLWINDTRANYGLTSGDYANFTVELAGYPGRSVELWSNYSDGTWRLWDSGSSPIENITQMATTGKFAFLGNYSGNENYTYSEETWILTVSSISLDSFLESMSPLSINQSQNTTVVGNCSCGAGTCNDVYIEIQADGNPIPSTSGGDLQVNGSSSYSLGQLSSSWASRSWNISGWMPGTYSITIKCNSTETGNIFSSAENLEVNDTENPTWSGNSTSQSSGIDYLQGRQYQFNVTWNDNKEINTVLIENNFSGGSPVNDTVTTSDGDVYYFDVSDLAAGTYVWREFANDTTDNSNATDPWVFVVDKSGTEAELYLNGSVSDQVSYYPNSTINATAVSNVSGLYVQLWRNGTLLANSTTISFDITQWPAWDNNFTVQVLGNENYSSSPPISLWWNISKGIVPLILEVNESWSVTYPTATNVTASGCPTEISCSLYRNDSGLLGSNEDNALLGAGGYEYVYNTSGGENYSVNSTYNILEVVKGDVQPDLSINTTWTETYPTATNVSCSVNSFNDEVSCSLYRNDSSVGNPDENLLGGGVYEYVANTSETENYSANSTGQSMILTIEPYPFTDIDLFLNGTQDNYDMNFDSGLNVTASLDNPPTGNIEIWTNYSDGIWKLWDSCTGCSVLENESFITDSGYWNFTANYSGNQNYSPSYESWYINVKDVISPFYSSNSTNSTGTGTAVEHRLKWEDNVDVSGYIFRFCNGTWNGTYCLGGTGLGLNYNDTVMGLNPSYRWLLDGDGTDSIDSADSDGGTPPNWVNNIIPNNDTVQCGDYTGSQASNLPDEPDINSAITYNKSISVWIVADTIDTTGNGRIIWEEGGATNSLALYVLNDGGRDQIFFSVVEGTSYDYVNASLDEGSLAHIGVSLDCSNQAMYLYINGTLVDSKTGGLNIGSDFASHGDDPSIGGLDNAADRHDGAALSGGFDGRIADLVYWGEPSKVLDGTDFNSIYQAGTDPGLEIWQEDEWQPFSGYPGWSNVTKVINSTEGSGIAWCVYANDSSNNWNYSSCDNPFSYTAEKLGYLEVELVTPPGNTIVEDFANFTVNATVYCRDGKCGDVYGTVKYNLTSSLPDTPVNTSFGDVPFFINETPAYALKSCMNDMQQDDFCNVTWSVNATLADTEWKMGVLFNSSYLGLDNNTDNITITIVPCIEEMSLQFSGIDFGSILPSTYGNDALGNPSNSYNITNSGSCISNIWLKGSSLVNETDEIYYTNVSFNNATDEYSNSYRIANDYVSENSTLKKNVPGYTNVTTYYFLDVPAIYAKMYAGNVTICLNSTDYETLCE